MELSLIFKLIAAAADQGIVNEENSHLITNHKYIGYHREIINGHTIRESEAYEHQRSINFKINYRAWKKKL